MNRILTCLGCMALLFNLLMFPAEAADFPKKPINVYCMYGPGGSTDLALRIVAEYAGKNGVTMNVINKPGGGGSQAAMEVFKSRPDGYNLFFAASSFIILTQMKNVGCTINDFDPIAYITELYMSFNVRTDSNIKTFPQWMENAKKEPGKYNYASPGSVNAQRMFMTKLLKEHFQKFEVAHVPYQSGHDVNTALLGNHVYAGFNVPGVCKPYVQSGEFTILAVSSPQRLPEYPEVPTFAELYGDEYTWSSFNAFFAPKKTPAAVIDVLSKVIKDALVDPVVLDKMEKIGMTAMYRDSVDAKKDIDRTQKLIRESLKDMNL